MTTVANVIIPALAAATSATTQYTSPVSTRTIIDKFTVTNTSGTTASITINLVKSGGAPAAGNTITAAQSVAAGVAYTCPEIVGHILDVGDMISTTATAAGLTIRASGRLVST